MLNGFLFFGLVIVFLVLLSALIDWFNSMDPDYYKGCERGDHEWWNPTLGMNEKPTRCLRCGVLHPDESG